MSNAIGRRRWAIAEGYISEQSNGPAPEMTSHEAVCILNTGDKQANITLTVYYTDREPVGPYKIEVPARRTKHVRFNDLIDPQPIPLGTEYAALTESDVNVIVQHTRLDSRQAENALMTTIAWSE